MCIYSYLLRNVSHFMLGKRQCLEPAFFPAFSAAILKNKCCAYIWNGMYFCVEFPLYQTAIEEQGGGAGFHSSHLPFLCVSSGSLWKYGPPWTQSLMGSRSLKLQDLGSRDPLFPRRASLIVPVLASPRMTLILTEMVTVAALWGPSMAVLPALTLIWQDLLKQFPGLHLPGILIQWVMPLLQVRAAQFERWRPDGGQTAGVDERLHGSAEHWWVLTLGVQERIVGKKIKLTQLIHSRTAILTFHFFMRFWFRRKMPMGQFSRNQAGYVTFGFYFILLFHFSSTGSEPPLWPIPQLTATPDL